MSENMLQKWYVGCDYRNINCENGDMDIFYQFGYVQNQDDQELKIQNPSFFQAAKEQNRNYDDLERLKLQILNQMNLLPRVEACKQNSQFVGAAVTPKENLNKPLPKYVEKYKTQICHFYDDYRQCPHGSSCQYAHNFAELRPQKFPRKYKSMLCNKFMQGYCPFGRRCTFLHQVTNYKKYIVREIQYLSKVQLECVPCVSQSDENVPLISIFQHGCQYSSVFNLLRLGILPPKINKT